MRIVFDHRAEGFTLVEVLLALTLVVTTALGVAELFALSLRVSASARRQTAATVLAIQKMEQLRALNWRATKDGPGGPDATDTSTDLSRDPPTALGAGLGPSPAEALSTNTSGYADYLDGTGRWVGGGVVAPSRAVFVRRWSIAPMPESADTLVLQVLVSSVVSEHGPPVRAGAVLRRPDSAVIVSVLTRKAP
jgi:type II secretory pathway pseudopilin PulG